MTEPAPPLDSSSQSRQPGATGSTAPPGLTPAEFRVCRLAVVEGRSNREIARELGLAEATVRNHLARVYRRFGFRAPLNRRAALASWWYSRRPTP